MANSKMRLSKEDLDVMSASKLNDLLISKSALRCSVCKNFLKPPIMFVSIKMGNVCGICNTFESNNAYRNSALEILVEDLVLPCKYFSSGCTISLNYMDVSTHETICPFRDYGCPLKLYDNCPWKGSKLNLLKHILSHSTFSAQTTDNGFAFNLPDDESTDFIKFFNLSSEDKFVFRARINSPDRLYFKIYHIGAREGPDTYYCKILQINCEGSITEFVHENFNIGDNFDDLFYQDIELNQMQSVNLQLCRLLAAKEKIDFVVQIMVNNGDEKFHKSIFNALECPVCKFRMRPPIFQCEVGHSICSKCQPQVTDCPVCRTNSLTKNIRNYSLEALASELYFPCYNRDFGCNVNLLLSEIENHENKCTYKLYKCEFCSWECQESSLIAHLKNLHREKILFQSCLILLKSFVESNTVFFISAFSRIFKVNVTKSGLYYFGWNIEVLGPQNPEVTFEYEIGGITKENITKKFVHSTITSTSSNIYHKYYLNILECAKI